MGMNMSMGKKICWMMCASVLTVMALSLLLPSAHAVSCSMSPDELWIDRNSDVWLTENQVSISCACTGTGAWSELRNGSVILKREILENKSGTYTGVIAFDTLSSGNYQVDTYCNTSSISEPENTTSTIKVNELLLIIASASPQAIYPGDTLDMQLEFKKNGEAIIADAEFDAYLGGTGLSIVGTPSFSANHWTVRAQVPEEFSDYAFQDLKVIASYQDHQFRISSAAPKYSEVKPLIQVKILDPPLYMPYRLTDSGDITVKAEVIYRNDLIDKSTVSGFEARLDDKEVKIKDIEYVDDVWVIRVNVPKRASRDKPYDLDISVKYNDLLVKSAKSIPVQFIVPFEGSLVNALGAPISGVNIKLKSPGFEEKIMTDSQGRYSTSVPPGNYGLKILFNELEADIVDVDLFSGDVPEMDGPEMIRYDYFEEGAGNTKKVFVLESGFPFERAFIRIPHYDSGSSGNDVPKVMRCDRWNFMKRTCNGDWLNVDATLDGKTNTLGFQTTLLSAFAILSKKDVNLDAGLDKERYALKETVTLSGKLIDEDLNAISDATIIYAVDGVSGKTATDSGGTFTATFKAPEEEGTFKLNIEAKNDPYIVKKTMDLTAYRKNALSISAAQAVSIDFDIPALVSFTIKNDGQAPLEDISIQITGIPSGWLDISQKKISNLGIGEKKDIDMKLLIPASSCTDAECMAEHLLGISAISKESSSTANMAIKINGAVAMTGQDDTALTAGKENKSNDSVSGFSVLFATGRGAMILIVGLVFIFFAAKMTRRKKDKTGESRNSQERSVGQVKNEVLKTKINDLSVNDAASSASMTPVQNKSAHESKLENILKNPFSTDK